LDLNEGGKENLKYVYILKKVIKAPKQIEELKKAQKALKAQVAQEAQVAKEAQEVKSKAEEIFQATRNIIWLKMELEQAKVRALQDEKILSLLSMTPWSKP